MTHIYLLKAMGQNGWILFIGIIMVVLCWQLLEIFATHANQMQINQFSRLASDCTGKIMNADRNSRKAASDIDEIIEDLEKQSFCSATHRMINDLKTMWRSKFLHLFPSQHVKQK